jgi:spermidine synthase
MIGDPDPELTIVEENAASVTALTPQPDGGYHLMINGRYNSWLPFGWLHSVIGALPALVHPNPREVAVVGLGSGDTAWGAGIRRETESVRVFEIASSQPRLLQRVASRPRMERLKQFLGDTRYTVVRDDGRRRLTADRKLYDIIVADAMDFDNSMITYLYSVEYYTLVRERLKPGGLVCVLARTPRIRASVRRAFPYTVYLREDLILASADPIVIDKDLWLSRLRSEHVIDYLGKARMRDIAAFVAQARYPDPAMRGAVEDANGDLDPRDEFGHPNLNLR